MKSLKGFTSFVVLLFAVSVTNGQLVRDLPLLYQPWSNYQQQETDSSEFRPWYRFTPGETSYSVEVGAGYSSFGNNMGFSNSYVSPTISISATENLQIVVGGKFSKNNFQNLPMLNQNGVTPNFASSGMPTEAFAFGRYIVNNKLSVYGMGAFGKNQVYFSPFNQGFSTSSYQHFSLGMDYRVSEKVSIGASFGFSNGPSWGLNSLENNRYETFPFMP